MRSLSNFQNDQANLYFMNMANENNRVPSLAPQFMDMFDFDTSLLRKRDFHSQENFYQKELQKKIKTSVTIPELTMPSSLQIPSFNPMAYNRNLSMNTMNPLLAHLNQDQAYGSLSDQLKQLQNLNLLKQHQNMLQSIQPLCFPSKAEFKAFPKKSLIERARAKNQRMNVKEEYVKQEELPTTQGSPSLYPFKSALSDSHTVNDRLSETSPVNTELQMPEPIGEPALVAFTREFPDWDLATIFNYIKSGKSREVFEKEKQFKMERKLRRQRTKLANKEKGAKKGKGKGDDKNAESA